MNFNVHNFEKMIQKAKGSQDGMQTITKESDSVTNVRNDLVERSGGKRC